MKSVFCTILSKSRLYQAIAFLGSLSEVMKDFSIFVLCVDDDGYNILNKMNWGNITTIHITDLQDEKLQSLRKQRKLNEFCWTLKPVFIQCLFMQFPFLERITYVDSDLFFLSNPNVIFRNQPEASVLLSRGEVFVPDFSSQFTNMMQELTGKYNSGFISFKKDETALLALNWWKEKCLNHCSDDLELNSFGDQKYLDFMPSLFPSICDISTPGVNIGHWNYAKFKFRNIDGTWLVDNSKLIFYHFSGFRILSKDLIAQIYEVDRKDMPSLYGIYINIVKHAISFIESIDPKFNGFATNEDMTTGEIKTHKTVDGE